MSFLSITRKEANGKYANKIMEIQGVDFLGYISVPSPAFVEVPRYRGMGAIQLLMGCTFFGTMCRGSADC